MRCDCESIYCEHAAGTCQSTVIAKVEWFGHRCKMCRVCINKAIQHSVGLEKVDVIQIVQLAPLQDGDK